MSDHAQSFGPLRSSTLAALDIMHLPAVFNETASLASDARVPDGLFVGLAMLIGGAALLLRYLLRSRPGDDETREIWMGGNTRWPVGAVRRLLAGIGIGAVVLAASTMTVPPDDRVVPESERDPRRAGPATSAAMHADRPPYPVRLTTASCNEINVALTVYRSRYARYPTGLTDSLFLSILRVGPVTYLSAPTDGWNHPFSFDAGSGGYRLSSPGPDGIDATGDEIVCASPPSVSVNGG